MKKNNLFIRMASTIVAVSMCCSCSDKTGKEITQETNPYILFKKGNGLLAHSKYKDAARYFERIEQDHPASDLAPLAKIRHAFSLYETNKPDDAIIIVEEFIQQYPVHPNADYMLYLKALCYYDQIVDVGRDQRLSHSAIEAFDELLAQFPDSIYTKDATLKREFALNSLAGKEMEVAHYYLEISDVMAAINRYKNVIDHYQTSIFTAEALFRLTECYSNLGLADEATKYAAVLGANYHNSKWYKKAYAIIKKDGHSTAKQKRGILQKIW